MKSVVVFPAEHDRIERTLGKFIDLLYGEAGGFNERLESHIRAPAQPPGQGIQGFC